MSHALHLNPWWMSPYRRLPQWSQKVGEVNVLMTNWCLVRASSESTPLSTPGHLKVTNSWHLLWTTNAHDIHWNPCLPNPQMNSLQWEQNVGCLKNRRTNLWSLTSKIFFFFNAPFRARKFRCFGGGPLDRSPGESRPEAQESSLLSLSSPMSTNQFSHQITGLWSNVLCDELDVFLAIRIWKFADFSHPGWQVDLSFSLLTRIQVCCITRICSDWWKWVRRRKWCKEMCLWTNG